MGDGLTFVGILIIDTIKLMTMKIHPLQSNDAPVFHSSVHQLARQHYTAEQLHAWAPADYDAAQWAERLHANRPWVAEVESCIAGFADLQPSGYIDQFFCSGAVCRARCGPSADGADPSGGRARGHGPALGRCQPLRRAVFQPQRLCGRGTSAGASTRRAAGECAHGQGAFRRLKSRCWCAALAVSTIIFDSCLRLLGKRLWPI